MVQDGLFTVVWSYGVPGGCVMRAQRVWRQYLPLPLFRDGNLDETVSRTCAAPRLSRHWRARRDRTKTMVACEKCAARFVASKEIEREWMQKHVERAHGEQRISRLRGRERAGTRRMPVRA